MFKVLFLDILITVGDVITDFIQVINKLYIICTYRIQIKLCKQGFNLIAGGDETFGIFTLATIWLPGGFGAIQWISQNRHKRGLKCVGEACK